MTDAVDHGWPRDESSSTRSLTLLANAARAAGPPLLFGLRLWVSVCLALYVAFWLELDNAYWAGTSAALVCQPHLGASLRKGWFRMIGTLVGAVFIVVLTGLFPQNRFGFLIGLALWGGACALMATLLRNFAAYAAALAGFTAAIIASDQLGATGGPNGQAFILAVFRVSEIWIGIVSAGIVLAGTDFGDAPRRLAAQFAALAAEIAKGLSSSLGLAGVDSSDTLQPVRREFIRRVIALDPVLDESMGESSRLRYHSPVLQGAINGLFTALAAWRSVIIRLTRLPRDAARQEMSAVWREIPQQLQSAAELGQPRPWIDNPTGMRGVCEVAVRTLTAMPATTPSLRLLADHAANLLVGFAAVLDGLALLVADPARRPSRRRMTLHVPDWLPALVNCGRAFVTIGAMELFWVVTAWPNGAFAIVFAAIVVLLLSPRGDQAYAVAMAFTLGTAGAVLCAAVVKFALLPGLETFPAFCMGLGLVLIPAGFGLAQSQQPAMIAVLTALAFNFVPLLQPTNPMSYDTAQFYNFALAVFVGCAAGALSFRLLPPLFPAFRAQRLLELTLRDVRRLATDAVAGVADDWESRIYGRLVVLPDQATSLQRAQFLTALSVGKEIIELRRIAPQLAVESELDAALEPFAQGNSAVAVARLERLDQRLAPLTDSDPQTPVTLRARGRILLICDALVQHRAYFDAEESA
jgi:uncharacterized membrane protein YccC